MTCLLHAPFVFALLKAKISGRSVQASVSQPAQSTVAFLRQKGIVSEPRQSKKSKSELLYLFCNL